MFSVTQFEVQVYHDRRWSIHARYQKNEREDAVRDAIATEGATRYPAKVIRENYYPENNTTETLTIYETPKARKLRELMTPSGKKLQKSNKKRSVTSSAAKAPQAIPQRLSARNAFFRILVAAAISLGTTTLIIGVLAWMLRYFAQAGVSVGAEMSNAILTYGYIAIFIFSFTSLFRSRLPLHRVLADLWASAQTEKPADVKRRSKEPPANLKPKHDRAPSPERIEEWKEMKRRRGDLDMVNEPESNAAETRAEMSPVEELVAETSSGESPEAEQSEPVRAKEKATATAEPPPPSADAEETDAAEMEQHENPSVLDEDSSSDTAHEADTAFGLEPAILLRFFTEVVKPVIVTLADDPVTRRGGALILAGASAALEQSSNVKSDSGHALLCEMDDGSEIAIYATPSFLKDYGEYISADENVDLVEAGLELMKRYLAGEEALAGTLSTILTEWRTPFSSPPELSSNEANAQGTTDTSLLGIYLLTELRPNTHFAREIAGEARIQAAYDAAMGAHNSIVRAVVLAFCGHEITHTGKGIFAFFESPDDALDAAADIQNRIHSVQGAAVAIAVIGNSDSEADPNFSPSLSRHAQEIVTRAANGQVLCERRVQQSAKNPHIVPHADHNADQSTQSEMSDPLAPIAVETIPATPYEDSARAS